MADIFLHSDMDRLTQRQSFLFVGDSNMRAMYKDFVWLSRKVNQSSLIPESHLRAKLERSFEGDSLIESSARTAGRDYKEFRDFYLHANGAQFTFFFVTRCYSAMLRDTLKSWKGEMGSYPDVVIMNGALWDLSRWGAACVGNYKENIVKLFQLLKDILPDYTQVLWLTSPPVSRSVRGALILPELSSIGKSLRFSIVEANRYAAKIASSHGYDVLDLHGSFICQMHRQCADGIHWHPDSVRMMTNLILTHYSLSRNCELPARVSPSKSIILRKMMSSVSEDTEASQEEMRERRVLKARRRIV